MKVFPFFATVLMRGSCCNHTGNKSIVTTVDDEPDSIIVLYDRQSDLILWDEARTYRTFIERRGSPLLKMKIKDTSTILYLDSIIKNATPNDSVSYVSTDFLLLRFRDQMIGTIALPPFPGFIQLQDRVYRDSLVYKTIMKELSDNDSIWLNESIWGAFYYQFDYLGNKKQEKSFGNLIL